MVFSRGCPPGAAKVLPCRNLVNSEKDLIAEAEYLWTAERLSDRANHRISAAWGCVALLVRSEAQIPANLLKSWASRVRSEPGYGAVPQADGEGTLVTDTGLLQIPWPSLAGAEGRPLDLDLLLATATHPTLEGAPPSYPSPKAIAAANAEDNTRYFQNNREHSIRTFQDEEILEAAK